MARARGVSIRRSSKVVLLTGYPSLRKSWLFIPHNQGMAPAAQPIFYCARVTAKNWRTGRFTISGVSKSGFPYFLSAPGKRCFIYNLMGERTRNFWCEPLDRKSTRLNSSHVKISYSVFCLTKKIKHTYSLKDG